MPVQSWKIKSHVIQQRAGVFFCRRAAFQIRTIRTNPTGSFVPILTSSRTARTSHTLVSIYGADASTVRRPASQAIASKQASKQALSTREDYKRVCSARVSFHPPFFLALCTNSHLRYLHTYYDTVGYLSIKEIPSSPCFVLVNVLVCDPFFLPCCRG